MGAHISTFQKAGHILQGCEEFAALEYWGQTGTVVLCIPFFFFLRCNKTIKVEVKQIKGFTLTAPLSSASWYNNTTTTTDSLHHPQMVKPMSR